MDKLLWLGIGIALALGGALWLEADRHTLAPLSWALGVSAVATFFTLLSFLPPDGQMTKSKTRNAITATFVVTYFLLLGLFVFFKGGDKKDELSAITDTLVTNFTLLMGVVIAFHFGTTAYEKVAAIRSAGDNPQSAGAIQAAAEASETEGTGP